MRRRIRWFCEDSAADNAKIPNDKLMNTSSSAAKPNDGFMNVSGSEEEIPF